MEHLARISDSDRLSLSPSSASSTHPPSLSPSPCSALSEIHMPGICIINANSIAKPFAIEQLHAELIGYDLTFAIITETHLKPYHPESMIAIEGFNLFRRDRIARKRGGVAIAVKDVIKANEVLIDGDNRQLELLWVKAETRAGIVYIVHRGSQAFSFENTRRAKNGPCRIK